MRAWVALVAAAVVVAGTDGSAPAAPQAKPSLVRLHWYRVARGVTGVSATDRYLAYSTARGVTLVDQRTRGRTQLSAAECPYGVGYAWLGGPWLVGCPDLQRPNRSYTRLYNIPGRYWVTVPAPASCGPDCQTQAVGSRWIKLESVNDECQAHCGLQGELLQNIRTGQAKRDPVVPGGRLRENLDSPSGTSPLCPPLRYPAVWYSDSRQLGPGDLTMLGPFGLSVGFVERLERCHSSWRLRIYGQPIIAGFRLVLWTDSWWRSAGRPSHGLLLPSRRQFTFYIPRRFQPGRYQTVAIAVSGRTIYLLTSSHTLWRANAPRGG